MYHLLESLEGRSLFAAGTLDTTFGTGGATTVQIRDAAYKKADSHNGIGSNPTQLIADSAGRTVMAVESGATSFTVSRLTLTGTVDTSFAAGSNNRVYFTGHGSRIAVDPSNRVYVLHGGILTRLTSRGVVDKSFGVKGNINLAANTNAKAGDVSLASGRDLVVDSQSRAWVLASVFTDKTDRFTAMKVFRFDANGQYDKTFDGDGVYYAPLPGKKAYLNRNATAVDMVLLEDGSVQVAGGTSLVLPNTKGLTSTGVLSVRFTAAGAVDANYADSGVLDYRYSEAARSNGAGNGLGASLDTLTDLGQILLHTTDAHAPYRLVDTNGYHIGDFGRVAPLYANGVPKFFGTIATDDDGARFVLNTRQDSANGTQYVLNHVLSDGTLDPDFTPVDGVTAATQANDGTIVYALGGSAAFERNADQQPLVRRIFADEGPVAAYGGDVINYPVKDYAVTVTWRDDDAIDIATLDNTDVYIRGNGFTGRGRFQGTGTSGGSNLTVTYLVRGPSGGWTKAANGTYAVTVAANVVKDTGGVGNAGRTIGTVTVALA